LDILFARECFFPVDRGGAFLPVPVRKFPLYSGDLDKLLVFIVFPKYIKKFYLLYRIKRYVFFKYNV